MLTLESETGVKVKAPTVGDHGMTIEANGVMLKLNGHQAQSLMAFAMALNAVATMP